MTEPASSAHSHARVVYGVFLQIFLFLLTRTLYVTAAALVAWPLLLGLTLAIDAGLVHPSAFMIISMIFFWPLYLTYGGTLMSGESIPLTETDFLNLATLWLVYLAIVEWVLRSLGMIKGKIKLRYYILFLTGYFVLTAVVALAYGANTEVDISAGLIILFISWLVTLACVSMISLLNSLKNWLLQKTELLPSIG